MEKEHILPENMVEMKIEADGYSMINENVRREEPQNTYISDLKTAMEMEYLEDILNSGNEIKN